MSCPPYFRLASTLTLTLACALPLPAQSDNPKSQRNAANPNTVNPKIENPTSPSTFKGSDVLATINGEPITRRELTNLWLKIDNQANRPLGMIILNRMRAAGNLAPGYTVTEADIYKALYNGPASDYAPTLSNLVTNRLVAREAKRQGITVTPQEAAQAGHTLMDEVRAQKNIKASDEQILTQFRVPRDIFLDEMVFRLRGEKLLAKSIARRNGHALGAEDWVVFRELFAGANTGTDAAKNAQEFADAKVRVQAWGEEVKAGKSFADVAKAHNEDETRATGGYRGPALRGTGTKEIEDAVFRLKYGEISPPLRAKDGWYIFLVEKRGTDIPASQRETAWKQVVEKRVTPFLADLRQHAKITSVIPLPVDTLTGQPTANK